MALSCQLVAGEGLAEAHLGVPEEARDGVHVFGPDGVVVGVGLFDGGVLLAAHGEGEVVGAGELGAGAEFGDGGADVRLGAAHPLAGRDFEALLAKALADLVVGEGCAIRPDRQLVDEDGVVLDRGGLELLGDAGFDVARGLADLEEAGVGVVVDGVGVDAQGAGAWGEELFGRFSHRRRPLGGLGSQ